MNLREAAVSSHVTFANSNVHLDGRMVGAYEDESASQLSTVQHKVCLWV